MLACDMYAMQFMEVSYELRGVLDLIVGIQPDERQEDAPLPHWPYARCLRRWQEIVATPAEAKVPRWRSAVDPQGLVLAKETVALLAEHYTSNPAKGMPVTVSAIDLEALVPVAQALDTFSVVYLQWLSNDVIWRAREMVFRSHTKTLEQSWSYDLREVAMAIVASLKVAASGGGRPMGRRRGSSHAVPVAVADAARDGRRRRASSAASGPSAEAYRRIANEIAACRAGVERLLAVVADETPDGKLPEHSGVDASVRALFSAIRPIQTASANAAEWSAIIERSRDRFTGACGARARRRVRRHRSGQTARPAGEAGGGPSTAAKPDHQTVVAVWPPDRRCGLALYRPIDLDKLAESNYLELRFSRDLHWTALLTAVDLIKHHARMLWRLLESQLTAAPLEARYQLMRRLAGDRALTGRHADQLRALSAPDALFLTIDPAEEEPVSPLPGGPGQPVGRSRARRSDRDLLRQAVVAGSIDNGRRAP